MVDTDKKRRFDKRDWDYIAEYVIGEYERRKRARDDRERHWAEIDRQVEMEPDVQYKKLPDGTVDKDKMWMSEVELPLQAQALEVLTADASRLMFGTGDEWFRAHAEVTDAYLEKADFQSLILGDELDVPSQINQDNADKLVQGFQMHLFRQGDFLTNFDRINAEVFKYGMGVGRARKLSKSVFSHTSKGVVKENRRLPVLMPGAIKKHYLDDRPPTFHSDQVLDQAHISEDWIKLENLAIAANRGGNDPDNPDGGWIPAAVKTLEGNEDGFVHLLEMEGDVVIPRKTTRSVVLAGCIITVAMGGKAAGNVTRAVVRFRWRKMKESSYLLFPYHYEGANDIYPVSPLMKGRPIQIMATDALNRLLDSAALKNAPPVGYDRSDMEFQQQGGPKIHPNAMWPTIDKVNVHNEVGGDPSALSNAMSLAINLYGELTGVLPARLGAQTVSHTTAFAKDAEIQRGAARTVDYANHAGKGPIERWLDMAYQMGRDELRGKIAYYIDSYGGFVEVEKEHLPENAVFEWFGPAGPAEEQKIMQSRLTSLQFAMQMDQLGVAQGEAPTINLGSAIREVLREGKWTDVEAITGGQGPAAGNAGPQGPAGPSEVDSGLASTAIQALAFGGTNAA